MASDDYNWTTALTAEIQYSEQERSLRDLFVAEYLVDYDGIAAAMRCGFIGQFASDYAKKFLAEPYVVRKVKTEQLTPPQTKEEEAAEEALNKRKIITGLMREAHNHLISGSARVAALSRLAVMYGLDQPPADPETVHRGGVMQVPAIADLSKWESAAMESQEQLVLEARS